MDLWEDAKVLAQSQGPWERYDIPKPKPAPVPVERPDSIRKREATRQQTLERKKAEEKDQQEQADSPSRKLQYIEYKWIDPSTVGPVAKYPLPSCC